MISRFSFPVLCAAFVGLATPCFAHGEYAKNVGLGVAAGLAYSPSDVNTAGAAATATKQAVGAGLAWGFFVDIPLLETFYVTPSAMLYEQKIGIDGKKMQATDIDINFKFIVPIGDLRLGAGALGGITAGADTKYSGHYGALGFASFTLVSNLEAFAMVQYKQLMRDSVAGGNITNIYGFAGVMFHFQ